MNPIESGRRGLLLSCAALAACANPLLGPPDADRPGWLRPPSHWDYLLLGEVHDNPEHHRRRLGWLERLAEAGRFALAMEQFDADRQPDIDAARARGADARALAESAGFEFDGWAWADYGPFVAFALRRDIPLFAANLPGAQARRIARGTTTADGPPAGWRPEDQAALEAEIVDGHCGLLPQRAVAPMALAQRARDASMARVMVDARRRTGLPVVLIAGNGHVRRDVGVPRHLEALQPGARVVAVGVLERARGAAGKGGDSAEPYDRVVGTAPRPREDPCEQMRRAMKPPA